MKETVFLAISLGLLAAQRLDVHAEPFVAVKDGQAVCAIVVDARGSTATEVARQNLIRARLKGFQPVYLYSLDTWGTFLADRIADSTGARPEVRLGEPATGKAIVISLAENYPEIAREAGLDFAAREKDPIKYWDAFAVQSTKDRLYILGHTELGCRYAVATVLRELGFRFYNPSPRWWISPKLKEVAMDLSLARAPRFFDVELATGSGHHLNHGPMGTESYPWDIQGYWFALNFLSGASCVPGNRSANGEFSYYFIHNVYRRNQEELEQHPEYFALLPDGQRDVAKPLMQRKLCVSNPGLVDLIIKDRIACFEKMRANDRFVPMVNAEYSTANYTQCLCPDCAKLGGPIDRKFHLVNQIARGVARKYPGAYVCTRVFAGTKVPAAAVEPNVFVTGSHDFLSRWKNKARLLGLNEGWGVYVPGKSPAQQIAYHQERIPKHLEAGVVSYMGGISTAWGLQTPVFYVAAQLFWDPKVNVPALLDEYFNLCFGKAAGPVRQLWDKFNSLPYKEDANILLMLQDLDKAYQAEDREDVRKRVVDLMVYLHGLILYREFEAAKESQPKRGDAYYNALLPLMKFLCQNSYRMMMDPSDMAQGCCQQTALDDGREEFYWYRWEKFKKDPVWMDPDLPWRANDPIYMGNPRVEATFKDEEIVKLFREDLMRFSDQKPQAKSRAMMMGMTERKERRRGAFWGSQRQGHRRLSCSAPLVETHRLWRGSIPRRSGGTDGGRRWRWYGRRSAR